MKILKLTILALLSCTAIASAQPRNVIFFIGDGMGPQQIKAATCYIGSALSFEQFPHQAECQTHAADSNLTDSGAAATAMATGQKVNTHVISMAYPGDGAELLTLLENAQANGKSTGLVTTTFLTHATPAAFAAHEPNRYNNAEIAGDYLNQTLPNVLFGSGSHGLSVVDSRNAGYDVATDTRAFQMLNTAHTRLSAQFGTSHMPYKYDYLTSQYPYPTLPEMVAKAIQTLDNNPNGFFLMVEGGRIDHACHAHDIQRSIHETIDFSSAVQTALDWAATRSDTLILVTADHETGGLTVTRDNGPAEYPLVSWLTEGHTATKVPVYAWGENSKLISGVMDNTEMFYVCTAATTPQPNETVIVDNRDNTNSYHGTWNVSSGPNPWNDDSVYSKAPGDTFTFAANLIEDIYAIYIRWTPYPSRSSNVGVNVTSNNQSLFADYISQKNNANRWNLIGIATLGADTQIELLASDNGSTCADAVKFTPLSQLTEITIDNADVLTRSHGTWSISNAPNPHHKDSLWSKGPDAYCGFGIPLGNVLLTCDVYATWTAWPSRSTNVPISIMDGYDNTITTTWVNQQQNASQWNLIAFNVTFEQMAAAALFSTSSTLSTCADAVKFVPCYDRQILDIEIVGPDTTGENSTTDYDLQATFTDNTTAYVNADNWNVEGLNATITEWGILTAPSVDSDTHLTITAAYSDTVKNITKTATKTVLVTDGPSEVEVIVDNANRNATSASGQWFVSSAPDPYERDSYYSKQPGATYTFTADLANVPYIVYARWTPWHSRGTNVLLDLEADRQHLVTTSINQQQNTAKWNMIAIATLAHNTQITLTASAQGSTSVDAVKFTPLSHVDQIIIDNGDVNTSADGAWKPSAAAGYYGEDSLWSKTPGDTYSYAIPIINTAPTFDIYARWTYYPSRSTNAPLQVLSNNQILHEYLANQQQKPAAWNLIAPEITFDSTTAQIKILSTSNENSTNADAIKLIPKPAD